MVLQFSRVLATFGGRDYLEFQKEIYYLSYESSHISALKGAKRAQNYGWTTRARIGILPHFEIISDENKSTSIKGCLQFLKGYPQGHPHHKGTSFYLVGWC